MAQNPFKLLSFLHHIDAHATLKTSLVCLTARSTNKVPLKGEKAPLAEQSASWQGMILGNRPTLPSSYLLVAAT